jgi:hypothetical protein
VNPASTLSIIRGQIVNIIRTNMKQYLLFSILFLGVSGLALFSGCADSVSTSDKVAPSVSVYSPLSDTIIAYGKTNISYDVSDDQGVGYIDVYAYRSSDNELLYGARFTVSGTTKPTIYFNLGSAKSVGKYIYYFLIVADKGGNLKYSDTLKNIYVARTLTVPPAPYNLSVTRLLNSRTLNISWSDSAQYVTQYSLERRIGYNGSFVVIQTLSSGYFNTNDSNVDTNVTYYYRIRSRNEMGYSDYSNEANSSGTGGSGNIPAPTNLVVIALGATVDSLIWKNNTSGNFIQVERRPDGYDTFTALAKLSPTVTYYVDASGLSAQGKYYYRVKVFSGNDSAWSNEASVTMLAFDIPAPTSLKATVVTDTVKNTKYVHLYWKETSNQIEYTDIERSAVTTTNYAVIGQFDGYNISKTYTFDDTTAVKGVAYYYRVRARSDTYGVNSPYSDAASVAIPSSKLKTGLGKK